MAEADLSEGRREGAFTIPIDILRQKLLLHEGIIMVSQGEKKEAAVRFVHCINASRRQFCPRIRLECVNQLRKILDQVDPKLEHLAESFRYRNRDFIFLVNQSAGMEPHREKAIAILQSIMQPDEAAIENSDRVSLIKFNAGLRRTFSLV